MPGRRSGIAIGLIRPHDDPEPGRAVHLPGLHGELSERGRLQRRRRVHTVATTGSWWPGLVGTNLEMPALPVLDRDEWQRKYGQNPSLPPPNLQ
jgi:hypothetical protein